jgi:hypothetical protein
LSLSIFVRSVKQNVMSITDEQNISVLSINNNNKLVVQPKDSMMTTTTEPTEIRPVRSMTCYICLENIVTMHKQFGLQNNCDHFFCFDCLLTWRRTVSFSIRQQLNIF